MLKKILILKSEYQKKRFCQRGFAIYIKNISCACATQALSILLKDKNVFCTYAMRALILFFNICALQRVQQGGFLAKAPCTPMRQGSPWTPSLRVYAGHYRAQNALELGGHAHKTS